jgi:hypothetical protein
VQALLRPIAPGKVSRPLPPWDVSFSGSFFYAPRCGRAVSGQRSAFSGQPDQVFVEMLHRRLASMTPHRLAER